MSDAVEISFEKLFRFLWRWGLVALLASVATACFVYLWISREAPTYYAEAVNFIDRSGVITNVTDLPEYTFAPLNVTAYRVAARSDAVLAGALESLGLSTTPADIEGLRRSITLSSDEQPGLLYVGVAAGSPSEAAEIANAIAARLVAWDSERAKAELDRIIEVLTLNSTRITERISQLLPGDPTNTASIQQELLIEQQRRLASATMLREHVSGGLGILTTASPPLSSVAPRPVFSAALAFLVTMALTLGALFVRDQLTTQLYSPPEISASTGVGVVATLPYPNRRGAYPIDKVNAVRDTLRYSRANSVTGKGPAVIHVTSGDGSNESSLGVAACLAESYARSGARTLLVDIDMRAPRLGRRYRIAGVDAPTLSDSLRGTSRDRGVSTILVSDSYPMDVLFDRVRVPDPGDLVSKGLAQRASQWRETYDCVVLHSPPILIAGEGVTVSTVSDATLLTVRERRARRRSLVEAAALLRRAGSRALGIVLTETRSEVRPSMSAGTGRALGTDPRRVDV